jgi:hypothetical protein
MPRIFSSSQKQASTSSGAVGEFVPKAATTAEITAAANLAFAAGGGVVNICNMDVTLTGPLPLLNGVSYKGNMGPWTTVGEGFVPTGGTILRCSTPGAFNAFEFSALDLATWPNAGAGIDRTNWLSNVRIEDIAFVGFKNAIKIGAKYQTGAIFSKFLDLFAKDCYEYGFYFENFQWAEFDLLVGNTLNGIGGVWFGSSGGNFNPGNSILHNTFVNKNKLQDRGVVVNARASGSFNDFDIRKIQVNSGGGLAKATNASSAAGTSLTLTDASFAYAGGYLTVDSDFGGLIAYQVYCIRSLVGNVVTVSDSWGGAVKTLTAGSGTVRMCGHPLVEVIGTDAASVQPISIEHFDAENDTTAAIYMENAQVRLVAHIMPGGRTISNTHTVVARGACRASLNLTNAGAPSTIDASSSSTVYTMGSLSTVASNGNQTNRGVGLYLFGGASASTGIASGSGVLQMRSTYGPEGWISAAHGGVFWNTSFSYLHGTATNGQGPRDGGNKIAVTVNAGASGTHILPTVVTSVGNSYNLGEVYYLNNPTANPCTVSVTGGAQNIVGGGAAGANTKTLGAYSSAIVIAEQLSGVGYWAWFGA